MARFIFQIAALLPALIMSVQAKSICKTIEAVAPGLVTYPGSAAYETAQVAYYAQQQIDLEPACRVGPKTAADVAAILKAAVDNKIPFAVHSGGHLTMIGGSNIADEGFSIDLGALNNFKIAKDEKSVTFGTGLRWGQIFPPLAEKGLTAVGGRDPGVGVGGYLAGGGISLMSYQHGLGGDNVIEYEVALASGKLVRANKKENSDLWWALKTGSTNFGIITSYTINLFPVGNFWAGQRYYNYSDVDLILNTFPAFVDASNYNKTAGFTHLVLSGTREVKGLQLAMSFQSEVAEPPLFKILEGKAKPIQDNMTHTDVLGALELIRDPSKTRTIARSLTFDNTVESLLLHRDQFEWSLKHFDSLSSISGWTFFTGMQPFPAAYLQHESPIHSRGTHNALLTLTKVQWDNPEDDDAVTLAMDQWLDYVTKEAKKRKVLNPLLYLNYIGQSQTNVYTESLTPADLKKIKQVRDKYDPKRALAKLWPGGFKIPA